MPIFVPKDRKSLFRQYLAGMYDAVVIADPNGYVLEINARAVEHFGYEAEELLDQPISVIVPGLAPEVVHRIRTGLADDRHVMVDANARHKDGSKIACEIAVSVIDMVNPGDLVFTIRNVERRRELMGSLRSKANAYRLAQTALFCVDPDGRLTNANGAFCALFGLADEEVAKQRKLGDCLLGEAFAEGVRKALGGETTEVREAGLEAVFAPDRQGRKVVGAVGSVRKV